MTERRVTYMDENRNYVEEQDQSSDTFVLYGLTVGAGNLAMGGNRITGIPNIPAVATDAVNQSYVDSKVTGLKWRTPAEVFGLVGNLAFAAVNALGVNAGDAYVVTDAGTLTRGSVAVVAGDVVQDNGTIWVKVLSGAGGFVPADARAVLSVDTALISPYTTSQDEGKIVDFDGAGNTGSDTSEATDGSAVLVAGEGAYHENSGFVFDGSVPTGTWIQFTGAGQVVAGLGLEKDGNTLNVKFGDGVKELPSDYVGLDLETTNPGLALTGTSPDKVLDTKISASGGVETDANGLKVKIASANELSADASGLAVEGVPTEFNIGATAVSANVTAPNLGTLTGGVASNADALHTHQDLEVEDAERVAEDHIASSAITALRAVCWSATADKIEHGDNSDDDLSQIIGIARTGAAPDATTEVVKHGTMDGHTGLTQRAAYYLGAAGALVLNASVPKPGRFIRLGYAKSGTVLDVQIQDYGRRVA